LHERESPVRDLYKRDSVALGKLQRSALELRSRDDDARVGPDAPDLRFEHWYINDELLELAC
jgi:hypothetical protein